MTWSAELKGTRHTTSPDLTAPLSRAPSTRETDDPGVDEEGSGAEGEEEEEDTEDQTVKERNVAETKVTVKIEDAHRSPANRVSHANRATSLAGSADARTGATIREANAERRDAEILETWNTETRARKEETITLLGRTTKVATTPTATVLGVVVAREDVASAADPAEDVDAVLRTTGTATTTSIMITVLDSSQDLAGETKTTGGTLTVTGTTGPRRETSGKSSVPVATVPDTGTGVVRVTAARVTAKPPRLSST